MSDTPVLTLDGLAFVGDRLLATMSSLTDDGELHVTPVGFTWDQQAGLVRVITSASSRKARNAAAGGTVVLCQIDGRQWLSLEGTARVSSDPDDVGEAERRYAERYREPRPNPARVAILISVHRAYGSPEFLLDGVGDGD
jgi:PPOX class probable F420-dependent enzyme